jgi:hypothetical protein
MYRTAPLYSAMRGYDAPHQHHRATSALFEVRDKMETHRSIVVEVCKVFNLDMTPEDSNDQPKE